jgi:polycystin 1L2
VTIFNCERWLADDKEDGLIDRLLNASSDQEKLEIEYSLKRESGHAIFDGHLWLLLLFKPTRSVFTRLDRLICCFVLVCMDMLLNIIYYSSTSAKNRGLQITPFYLSPEEVGVGIVGNLLLTCPMVLLILLFRCSKKRKSHILKLNENLNNSILIPEK